MIDVSSSQGELSVSTTRLLKSILPASCLWTGLRSVEGFDYDDAIRELNKLYPADEYDILDDEQILNDNVPKPIRDMIAYKGAIQALGATIWCAVHRSLWTTPTYAVLCKGTFVSSTSTRIS